MKDEVWEFKRERILQAAVPLFAEHGFQGVSIDTIAKNLRVTKPFIYTYFKNKHALLDAIYERAVHSLLEGVDKVFAEDRPPQEQLQSLVEFYVLENIRNASLTAIFLNEEKHLPPEAQERVRAQHDAFDKRLAKLLERGKKEGVFGITNPMLASLAISGMVRWVHRWYNSEGRLSPDQIAREMAALALNLVKFQGPAKGSARASRTKTRPGAVRA